jgi:hypothetical protein
MSTSSYNLCLVSIIVIDIFLKLHRYVKFQDVQMPAAISLIVRHCSAAAYVGITRDEVSPYNLILSHHEVPGAQPVKPRNPITTKSANHCTTVPACSPRLRFRVPLCLLSSGSHPTFLALFFQFVAIAMASMFIQPIAPSRISKVGSPADTRYIGTI